LKENRSEFTVFGPNTRVSPIASEWARASRPSVVIRGAQWLAPGRGSRAESLGVNLRFAIQASGRSSCGTSAPQRGSLRDGLEIARIPVADITDGETLDVRFGSDLAFEKSAR
jgi:hypothetical protein